MTERRKHLELARYESKRTKYVFLPCDSSFVSMLNERGALLLGRDRRERRIWSDALVGDLLILLVSLADRLVVYATRVTGKGFPQQPPESADGLALMLHVDIIGAGDRKGVPPAAAFPLETFATRATFQPIWEDCEPETRRYPQTKPWTFTIDDYEVSLAQDDADYEFVRRVAERHPFGLASAFVVLVARRDGKRFGAVLMGPAWTQTYTHNAAWRIFHEHYVHIREHAVELFRLYWARSASRWRVHRALLTAASEVAPHIARRPLSVIEGASYDYHPVPARLGYYVDVPRRPEGAFYYWKPFTIPSGVETPAAISIDNQLTRLRLENVLTNRRGRHYWLAWAQAEPLRHAIQRGAWALHRNVANVGRWKLLRPGHEVFLTTHDRVVRAVGKVTKTEFRSVQGLEMFPLWIDFAEGMVTNASVDIRDALKGVWFKGLDRGGLIPLPPELGAKIREVSDQQRLEGKMWVEPNPYLLHQTQFDVTAKQVFVVQSASLSHTVLPVIRGILEPRGYIVKYWGDRGGQLVFDDIWLLLNESEIVIVDFTEKRPNVYLEYGMALVLGKPIIAITQRKEDIPSDTSSLKYILYNDKLGDASLRDNLPRAVEHTVGDIERIRSQRATTV